MAANAALAQAGIWIFSTSVLTIAVAAIYLGNPAAEPIAIVGSLIIFADMLFFAFLVFRPAPERSTHLAAAEQARRRSPTDIEASRPRFQTSG
jgi:hypothetical protein